MIRATRQTFAASSRSVLQVIFRLSQKLCTRIKAGRLAAMPLDENSFADWSCNLFTAERTQYVILTNTASLYSCLMFGRGLANNGVFAERAVLAIRESMEDDGRELAFRRFIAPAAGMVSFAKALSRSVTGSMNDLVHAARWHLASGTPLHEVGHLLNKTPLSAIDYQYPREAFTSLMRPSEGPR